MIQQIYKKTVEILVWVQILINIKIAHQAVKRGARHKKWKRKWMHPRFRLLSGCHLGNAGAARHRCVPGQVWDPQH